MEHKGWNRRGYLPHCDFADNLQAITFRLADSLPRNAIASWKRELEHDLNDPDPAVRRTAKSKLHRQIASYEDAGHDSRILHQPAHAEVVQKLLISPHGTCYQLIDWYIMPNHVHVLMREFENHPLAKVVQKWKGSSSLQINRLQDQSGSIWMPDYHDRLIRDEEHFYNARAYIRQNPVKAGLCSRAEDWPFSSCGVDWNSKS